MKQNKNKEETKRNSMRARVYSFFAIEFRLFKKM